MFWQPFVHIINPWEIPGHVWMFTGKYRNAEMLVMKRKVKTKTKHSNGLCSRQTSYLNVIYMYVTCNFYHTWQWWHEVVERLLIFCLICFWECTCIQGVQRRSLLVKEFLFACVIRSVLKLPKRGLCRVCNKYK